MFSEKIGQLGETFAAVALAIVVCALSACGERILVGTQPAEAPSDALPTNLDAGTERTDSSRTPAADEPDSDGDDDDEDGDDDDEPSDGDDDDRTDADATD